MPALTLAQLSGSEAVQYDTTKFVYLGRAATEPRGLLVGKPSGIKSIDDLMALKRPFVFPSQGTDEDFYTMVILANSLHFNLKMVTGYEGQGDTAVAVIKGDGDGLMTATRTAEAMIKSGDMLPILSVWAERDPSYPDVPTALEVTSGSDKTAVEAIVNMLAMHRGFFAPPGMDPEVTADPARCDHEGGGRPGAGRRRPRRTAWSCCLRQAMSSRRRWSRSLPRAGKSSRSSRRRWRRNSSPAGGGVDEGQRPPGANWPGGHLVWTREA